MAIVNEIIRQTQSTEFWVNSRLLIVFPLIVVFSLANVPLVLKHSHNEETQGKPVEPMAPAA
jgi:intracellular septation protein